MDVLELDGYHLSEHGDETEKEFWPFLSDGFPAYELLWRQLIVPLTKRVDPRVLSSSPEWIQLRTEVPPVYEKISMRQYSAFYFLGRAAKRFAQEKAGAVKHPEDIFFLLQAVKENFNCFRQLIDALGKSFGIAPIFTTAVNDLPPFHEVSEYRNAFLHNPVIGRAVDGDRMYLPKWNKSGGPLRRAMVSWRAAQRLLPEDLINTADLLERLINEVRNSLEDAWRAALGMVTKPAFRQQVRKATGLEELLAGNPLASGVEVRTPALGSYSGGGSNSHTGIVQVPAMLRTISLPTVRTERSASKGLDEDPQE